MPLEATPVSVATPRCGIWPTVFCGVLAADQRLCPFQLLQRAQNRSQPARHTDAVGLRDSSETRILSSATRGSPGGQIPTTGWPTIKDIGQAGLFASSVAQSRPSTIRWTGAIYDSSVLMALTSRGTQIRRTWGHPRD